MNRVQQTLPNEAYPYLFLSRRGLSLDGSPWCGGLDEVGDSVPETHYCGSVSAYVLLLVVAVYRLRAEWRGRGGKEKEPFRSVS